MIAHMRLIRRVVPGEALGAHMVFDEAYTRHLTARNCAHFFIYRDLRDVAVCEAHYLTHANIWHRLHPFFVALPDDATRISAALQGFAHNRFPYHYPNIAQRFARYKGWLDRHDVLPIAYEDLCSSRMEKVVGEMVRFYARRRHPRGGEDHIADEARTLIAAARLQVPHHNGIGCWVHSFTDEHHRQFEEVAGGLNRSLGYE